MRTLILLSLLIAAQPDRGFPQWTEGFNIPALSGPVNATVSR